MVCMSSRELIKLLNASGGYFVRSKGSHLTFEKKGCKSIISFPNKRCDLNPLLLNRLLKLIDKSN